MDVIEKIIRDNCWQFPKGYPIMDDPKDKELLNEIISQFIPEQEEKKEEKLEDKLIKIIRSSELNDDELNAYIKSISNRGLKSNIVGYLNKRGFSGDSFKVGDKAMDYVFDKISDSEAAEFSQYTKTPKTFKNAPDKGNFKAVTGLSSKLIGDLINIEPGADVKGNAIGKGELFLALAFNDIDNRTDGAGDLNFQGKNLEVKGTGGRFGQRGEGKDLSRLTFLGEKYFEGEELESFLNDDSNKHINVSIKNLYDQAIKNGDKSEDIIKDIQKQLDGVYWDKGLAKKYFNGPADFKDLAEMKLKLIKLNAESYARKTNVGSFLFLDPNTGDYALIDVDNLEDSVDAGLFGTQVKDPIAGYRWYNPYPQMSQN